MILDALADGYRTDPSAILGSPTAPFWSWRQMLVCSQMLKRRYALRREAERQARDRDESRRAAQQYAKQFDSA